MRFFNPSDLIGCGGDINQSDSFRYAEGVRGGGTQRGYTEGICRVLPLATSDVMGDNWGI